LFNLSLFLAATTLDSTLAAALASATTLTTLSLVSLIFFTLSTKAPPTFFSNNETP